MIGIADMFAELDGSDRHWDALTVRAAISNATDRDRWKRAKEVRRRRIAAGLNTKHSFAAYGAGCRCDAERPVRWVLPRGAELYAASKANRKADTHLNALSVARRWGRFCVKQKLLKANPFEDVEGEGRRRRGSSKDKLRVDESRVLQAACHVHRGVDGALVLSYLLLGNRVSEMTDRVIRDLDDGARLLWIDRTKTEAGSRHLELPDELRTMLLEVVGDRGPDERIFLNLESRPMSRRVAYQRVMDFTAKVIGRALGPQGLRRTQSTLATAAGATGPMVSAHLGHVTQQRMAKITERSYVDPNAVSAARIERSFRVLAGGKS